MDRLLLEGATRQWPSRDNHVEMQKYVRASCSVKYLPVARNYPYRALFSRTPS